VTLAIEADNLVKAYGNVNALNGLSFEVEQGEFFGLLGPNGAGKTTFINILVGLARATGGRAEVFGHNVETNYREARNRIGLAPQEFNVDRFFPIHEVLEHKAGYHGVPPAEATSRAEEALRTVGIWEKRNTRFDWLSGGMKRRFLLARALVTNPDLLILDEPTAGVDVQLRRDLWRLIERLNAEGTTILLTTHYIEEAERLCDRVAIVDSGRKVEVATPDELRSRGTDTLVLTAESPIIGLPNLSFDGVHETTVDGRNIRVVADSAGSVAADVVRALDEAGIAVAGMDVERASLEEVFVTMTRLDTEVPSDRDGDEPSSRDPSQGIEAKQ
jgi:ABC-2 type transport system ATP-binding protein